MSVDIVILNHMKRGKAAALTLEHIVKSKSKSKSNRTIL